jgi:hypothetical protein
MLDSIYKNIGVFFYNNLNVKNSDLAQGKNFLRYEHDVTVNTFERLPYLELTSMPGLNSINEAFNGDDSVIAANKNVTDNLTNSEQEFNKTLSEYSTLQRSMEHKSMEHKSMEHSGMDHKSMDQKGMEHSDNVILKRLSELNDTLVSQAKKISSDISNLRVDDESLRRSVRNQQANLNKYITTLESQKMGIRTNEKTRSYHYLMWLILFFTIILLLLTTNILKNALIVVTCLIVIYILAKAIHDKYN